MDKDRRKWTDPRAARGQFGLRAEKYVAQKLRIRHRTREKYESTLRNYLLPTFGTTSLGAVTKNAVQEWVADMVRGGLKP